MNGLTYLPIISENTLRNIISSLIKSKIIFIDSLYTPKSRKFEYDESKKAKTRAGITGLEKFGARPNLL